MTHISPYYSFVLVTIPGPTVESLEKNSLATSSAKGRANQILSNNNNNQIHLYIYNERTASTGCVRNV